MKLELFVLCDAATESGGKLNILGVFDGVFAKQAPVVHSQCAVALRVRFARIEEGDHKVRLNFVDEDGKPVIPPLEAHLKIVVGPDSDSAIANLILNIHQLKLQRFGEYSVDLAVDGRQEASLPLFCRQKM